jgi:hypothetical protein
MSPEERVYLRGKLARRVVDTGWVTVDNMLLLLDDCDALTEERDRLRELLSLWLHHGGDYQPAAFSVAEETRAALKEPK